MPRDVCAHPLPFTDIALLLQGITDIEALAVTVSSLKTWCDPWEVELALELAHPAPIPLPSVTQLQVAN